MERPRAMRKLTTGLRAHMYVGTCVRVHACTRASVRQSVRPFVHPSVHPSVRAVRCAAVRCSTAYACVSPGGSVVCLPTHDGSTLCVTKPSPHISNSDATRMTSLHMLPRPELVGPLPGAQMRACTHTHMHAGTHIHAHGRARTHARMQAAHLHADSHACARTMHMRTSCMRANRVKSMWLWPI